jgi:hypothetical protein
VARAIAMPQRPERQLRRVERLGHQCPLR